MASSLESQLKRISAESRAHVLRSKSDCADAAEHVRSSRQAVHRSFRLLRDRVHRGAEGELR